MRSPIIALLRSRRLLALSAGAAVLCAGGTVTTLAAWQDREHVWGGTGDTDGTALTASLFDVQQNTSALDGANFVDEEDAPGGRLTFGLSAGALTPGDTVFSFMQLRTVTGSRGGTLSMSGATPTPANALSSALTWGARVGATRAACSAAGFSGTGTVLVASGTPITTGSGSTTFDLPAATAVAPGAAVGICTALTLPVGTPRTVGGLTTKPVWHFDAISN